MRPKEKIWAPAKRALGHRFLKLMERRGAKHAELVVFPFGFVRALQFDLQQHARLHTKSFNDVWCAPCPRRHIDRYTRDATTTRHRAVSVRGVRRQGSPASAPLVGTGELPARLPPPRQGRPPLGLLHRDRLPLAPPSLPLKRACWAIASAHSVLGPFTVTCYN